MVDDIYCTGEPSTLEYTAKRLPRDFELRFRWRGDSARILADDVDGNAFLFEHHDYIIEAGPEPQRRGFCKEEGICYGAAASRIGITTLPGKIIEPSPPPGLWESHGKKADSKLLRNAGEWNEGSIRCVGSQIECRLNGGEVFQYDSADPGASKWSDRKVAADWVAVKEAGFKLTVSCDNRPIWIRDIRLCDLTKPKSK